MFFGPASDEIAKQSEIFIGSIKVLVEYKNFVVFAFQIASVMQKSYCELRSLFKSKNLLSYELKKSIWNSSIDPL